MILDSHQSEPDPVNAIEKVLIHRSQNSSSLTMLWSSLREKGFELRGDAMLQADFPELLLAEEAEWRHAYLGKVIAFKVVDSLETAIAWINQKTNVVVVRIYRITKINRCAPFAIGLFTGHKNIEPP